MAHDSLQAIFTSYAALCRQVISLVAADALPVLERIAAIHASREKGKGGTIFTLGVDRSSRGEADHYFEELVSRYRAGAKLNPPRGDRETVDAVDLSYLLIEHPRDWGTRVRSHVSSASDILLVFGGSSELPKELLEVLDALSKRNIPAVVVGPGAAAAKSSSLFPIPSDDPIHIAAAQSTILHVLCEPLEPEWRQMETQKRSDLFASLLEESAQAAERAGFDAELLSKLAEAKQVIFDRLCAGGRLLALGNGGSLCDARQIMGLFAETPLPNGEYPRLATGFSLSSITCSYNDGLDPFIRAVETIGEPSAGASKDVFIGISTSGNSRNISDAITAAKGRGVYTVTIAGCGGGRMKGLSDCDLIIPCATTAHVQEMSLLVGGALC